MYMLFVDRKIIAATFLMGGYQQMKRKTFIVLFLWVFIVLFACNQSEFVGYRIANPDSYRLDIEKMNGTDIHTMEFNAGDALDIHFETEHGKLHMEIKAPDGTPVYTGNGEAATDFTLNVFESGEYSVFVKAHNAKGNIYIRLRTTA